MLGARGDRRPGSTGPEVQTEIRADRLTLGHCRLPADTSQRKAIDDALRLLAVWAARAARAHTRKPDST
jgi:hypothetical protein